MELIIDEIDDMDKKKKNITFPVENLLISQNVTIFATNKKINMKYTTIPRSLIYRSHNDIEEFMNEHPLNEVLLDNINNISWMREGDFETNAIKCMDRAYYICLVMRMTKKPKYQTGWCYQNAACIKNDGGLSRLVTMALVLQLIKHGNEEWGKANADFVSRIEEELSAQTAVRMEETELGIAIPQHLYFNTILDIINMGIEKVYHLPDKLFMPIPILEGICNTYFEPNLIEGLNYIIEQVRNLDNRDEQQQCVDKFMLHFKHIVNNQSEIQNAFNRIEALCQECNLTIPERILEEKGVSKKVKKVNVNINNNIDKDKIIKKLKADKKQLESTTETLKSTIELLKADLGTIEADSKVGLTVILKLMENDGANFKKYGNKKVAAEALKMMTGRSESACKAIFSDPLSPTYPKHKEKISELNGLLKKLGMKTIL